MENINDYIKRPKEERQAHLKLNEPCLERGGYSVEYKGMLAHIHNTTIPKGRAIHVCHACNNAACSNPNHLYWGTVTENNHDKFVLHGKHIWDYMVEKYGYEGACKRNARSTEACSEAGKANTGVAKSDEHKAKIAASLTGKKRGPYKTKRG